MSGSVQSSSAHSASIGDRSAVWRSLPPSFTPGDLPPRWSLPWLIARFQTMSAEELGSRAWRGVRHAVAGSTASAPVHAPSSQVNWLPAPSVPDSAMREAVVSEANRILDGQYPLLNRWIDAGDLPRWDRPFDAAKASSPYLLDPARELRYALELNRHGHFVTLAQGWLLTRDVRLLERIAHHVLDWIGQCRRGAGPGWSSAIEPSMRLLQWSVTWQWTADCDNPIVQAVRTRWLRSVYEHVEFVQARLSSHSSANNHLIAELTALVVAAATWPGAADRHRFGLPALDRLEHELLAQHSPDGVNREQAVAYQIFVFDLYLIARLAAPVVGRGMRPEVDQRMAASARFVAALRNRSGELPAWGDNDDADAVPWTRGKLHTRAARMISLAAAAGVAPELTPLADANERAMRWLDMQLPRTAAAPFAARQSLPRGFPEGGYFQLGSDFGGPREVLACIDCGPLGYLRIAAHGHADALAVTLSVGGHAVLVDRGTFSYNAEPTRRRGLRGTLQHNTVTVDGRDQSFPAGPFLWRRHARSDCLLFRSTDAAGEFVGRHDGYAELRHPVEHERRLTWDQGWQRLTVTDTLRGSGAHDVAVAWHLAPGCSAQVNDRVVVVHASCARLSVRAVVETLEPSPLPSPAFNWLHYHGDRESDLGWHAASFGALSPACTLVFGGRADGAIRIVTTLTVHWPDAGDLP